MVSVFINTRPHFCTLCQAICYAGKHYFMDEVLKMVKDRPFVFLAYNTVIVLMGLTLIVFLHYFDVQDQMYVRLSKVERQLQLTPVMDINNTSQ